MPKSKVKSLYLHFNYIKTIINIIDIIHLFLEIGVSLSFKVAEEIKKS